MLIFGGHVVKGYTTPKLDMEASVPLVEQIF